MSLATVHLIKESPTHQTVEYRWDDGDTRRSRLQRYLCMGGPLDGQRMCSPLVADHGYIQFNCGENKWGANKTPQRAVFIHPSLFP